MCEGISYCWQGYYGACRLARKPYSQLFNIGSPLPSINVALSEGRRKKVHALLNSRASQFRSIRI